MKSSLKPTVHSALATESKPPINIAIAYADSLTRRIAKGVSYRLIRRIHRAFDVRAFFWSFDALGQPGTLEKAAAIAARADMILYSVHATQELPAAARSWADLWLARTGQSNGALVALLKASGPADGAPLAAEIQLSALARAARMDFFVKVFDQPDRENHAFESPRAAKQVSSGSLSAVDDGRGAITSAIEPACALA